MMQAMPPETMENSVLVRAATTPASASPRRGLPVVTAIWMDWMRPRNSSVMASCKMVDRSTAETMSMDPATARASNPNHSRWTTPKRAMATPQAAITTMTVRPRRETRLIQPATTAMTSAPAAGAA